MSALEKEFLEKLETLGSKGAKLLFLDELRQKVEGQSEMAQAAIYEGITFPGALDNKEWDRHAARLREEIQQYEGLDLSVTAQDLLDEIREEASWRGLSS